MSATPLHWIPDHERQHENKSSGDCRPISAEAGGRPVSATRVGVRDERVVFAPDIDLWVYRSYPLAITPRPGPALETRVPAWHIRGIFVEPQDLTLSDEFKDCSVVYAMWPNAAAWWEAAPFTLRHSRNVLSYDRLFTSLLPFPDGCDVSLQGQIRPIPGHLRDGITGKRPAASNDDKKQKKQKKQKVRSALMLDPMRLAPEWTTGKRARGHASGPDSPSSPIVEDTAGAELWHWAVVKDLDACVTKLLEDPELDVFRGSVAQPDFLAKWFRPADDTIPVPKGPPEEWIEEARNRWLLPKELTNQHFVDQLLENAARYALAGPCEYEAYLGRCKGWVKTGRRAALLDPETPLAFPLVQNIYATWLATSKSGLQTATLSLNAWPPPKRLVPGGDGKAARTPSRSMAPRRSGSGLKGWELSPKPRGD